jgi:hypothetical protein
MIRAKFAGGPLDGQEIGLPEVVLEVYVGVGLTSPQIQHAPGQTSRATIGAAPYTRYVKHYERRGIAHYYIPTS